MPGERFYAVVMMFEKKRRCVVTVYGEPQEEYSKDQRLWIERAEDEYGISSMKPPFCTLTKQDWNLGTPVSH